MALFFYCNILNEKNNSEHENIRNYGLAGRVNFTPLVHSVTPIPLITARVKAIPKFSWALWGFRERVECHTPAAYIWFYRRFNGHWSKMGYPLDSNFTY